MDSCCLHQLELQSFPGSTITLPPGTQVLTPTAGDCESLDRATVIQSIQERVLAMWTTAPGGARPRSCKLLLLLPDKTRRQTAARLSIDAVLDLCERDDRLSLTILFGLGTHPRMAPEDVSRILEPERERRLASLAVPLLQQTTLDSLPCRSLRVADPRGRTGETVVLQVPEQLWSCDLLLVAGDTDLHPYEGRAGSGGIHKMLAIGVGCMSTVRITHSLDVLTDRLTRPGETGNRFVQLIDHFALEIIRALRGPSGRLLSDPLGISVVCRQRDQVEAFWIGDREEERAALMEPLARGHTLIMRASVDVVIADTEREKGTDLLAGARSLHLLSNFNDGGNTILSRNSPCRSALLFNPCHEQRNAQGIGNSGTVLHLQALLQFSLETWRSIPVETGEEGELLETSLIRRLDFSDHLKTEILDRWERYLFLVSEEETVFGALEQALEDAVGQDAGTPKPALRPLQMLDQALPNSFGAHHHLFSGVRARLLCSDPFTALEFLRQASDEFGFKGLGEGGQRALRLLALLRTFDQLHVATDNPVVLDFLRQFSPGAEPVNSAEAGDSQGIETWPFGLIGLYGISLRDHTPQQALEHTLHHHNLVTQARHKTEGQEIRSSSSLAFLQQPVILKCRGLVASMKTTESLEF